MPAKGKGMLQILGDAVANIMKNTIPFPIPQMSKGYWACIGYVTNEDYKCINGIIKNHNLNTGQSPLNTRQLRAIIKHAKRKLQ